MPRATLQYMCPWCAKRFQSTASLNRHYAHQPTCDAKRERQLGRATISSSPLSYPGNDLTTPDLSHDEEAVSDNELPSCSPCATPSMAIPNEPEREDLPAPPLPDPSPCSSTFGYAAVDKHPTAGYAAHWECRLQADLEPQPDDLLRSRSMFQVAEWLGRVPITDGHRNEFFGFDWVREGKLPWKNTEEYYASVDALPHGPKWSRRTVTIKGDRGIEKLDLWMRDIIEVVRMLIGDPRFRNHTRYAPEKHWASSLQTLRVYDEMWSGEWWWSLQSLLPDGATIAPLIISSDKTQLSLLSGNKKAWPVYLSIGNISKSLRRRPSQRATLLIGYIPVSDLLCISNEDKRREKQWELFHSCMAKILAPLRSASIHGVEMVCADGGVRHVHPILAAYVADFLEQCLVAGTYITRCPICVVPERKRGNYGEDARLRNKSETISALHDRHRGYLARLKALGIRAVKPFWVDLPFVSSTQFITPDLLHQIHKGVLKTHLVKWVSLLLGADEIDRRFVGMPRYGGVRHFKNGISKISQWTGNEAKAIAKVFVPLLGGSKPSEAVGAARALVDFLYRAHLPQIDDYTLERMDANLAEFHDYKDIFKSTKVLMTKKLFNGIPKIHMLEHYSSIIRLLGTTDGYNTEASERLHIDYVKDAYRASNGVDPTEQMARYLQRREAWALLAAQLEELGIIPRRRTSQRSGVVEGDFAADVFDVTESGGFEDQGEANSEGAGDDEGKEDSTYGDEEQMDKGEEEGFESGHVRGINLHEVEYHPSPTIWIAKRPSDRIRGCKLIDKYGAQNLIPNLRRFLSKVCSLDTSRLVDPWSTFRVWKRCRLEHKPLPFAPLIGPHVDMLRAFPSAHDREGRLKRLGSFDVVLIDFHNNLRGLHAYHAGRARLIFQLPNELHHIYPHHLVYVELFTPFSRSAPSPHQLHTTSHSRQNNRRATAVVPLSDIRATCHLSPQYRTVSTSNPITFDSDLLSSCSEFFFNKYSSFYMNALAEHWEELS